MVKKPPANAGHLGSIPGLGRSPGVGNDNQLQYSCMENSMDRGIWQATVRGVTKNQTCLSNSAPTYAAYSHFKRHKMCTLESTSFSHSYNSVSHIPPSRAGSVIEWYVIYNFIHDFLETLSTFLSFSTILPPCLLPPFYSILSSLVFSLIFV